MRLIFALVFAASPALAGVEISNCEAGPRVIGASLVVNCDVHNPTETAVAHFTFKWKATQSDRAVPWGQNGYRDSEYPKARYIEGGIEPSETVTVSFFPGLLPDRADLSLVTFTFEAVDAFDVNSELITQADP